MGIRAYRGLAPQTQTGTVVGMDQPHFSVSQSVCFYRVFNNLERGCDRRKIM